MEELEKIREMLKYEIIKRYNTFNASRMLYDHNDPDRFPQQVFFDFSTDPRATPIDKKFLQSLKNIAYKPESVLKVVKLPSIASEQMNYINFFDYLRNAGVKKIFHLIVDDTNQRHTDTQIKSCLKGFEIERLNWRRPNFPVSNHLGGVQRLSLYWNGLDTVLQGWSSKRGLTALKDLRELKITISSNHPQELEAEGTFSSNWKEFVHHLHKQKGKPTQNENVRVSPSIESRDPQCPQRYELCWTERFDTKDSEEKRLQIQYMVENEIGTPRQFPNQASTEKDSGKPTVPHEWYNHMVHYVEAFSVLLDEQEETLAEGKKWPLVKVAIVDDGILLPRNDLGYNICGESFNEVFEALPDDSEGFACDTREEYQDDECGTHFYMADGNHGNSMATLVSRMCPRVHFHICRVKVVAGKYEGTQSFTVDSVRMAIEWATRHEVDIISMSLSIESERMDDARMKLNKAIQEASNKGIVIFCSCGDGRPRNSTSLEADDNTITIGAANSAGNPPDYVGRRPKIFLLPGVDIGAQGVVGSGSSISTALAAGLAGLILHLNQVSFQMDHVELRKKVKTIFERMRQSEDNPFLEVWRYFKEGEKIDKHSVTATIKRMLDI
ncbi:peptidase S8/S53 domain-containing protein [Amylocarpus encephaloides]|uniref:Peptidase S8/S53 domain-containing protein n=1 Tax=Amylocarpus encephaloides TaxID=45428 RepID=A0A9P7YHZ0_9HELO|nr:peptidase S8/S53 domain-containing protein [Amylocarpus encephaloides]